MQIRGSKSPLVAALFVVFFGAIAHAAPTDDQKAILRSLHFQSGKVLIANGAAQLDIGEGYRYLDAKDAATFLTKLEGNAPSAVSGIDGLFLPTAENESWFAVLSYSSDGHVKDDDAASIKYDDLLKQMQTEADQDAKAERDAGYPGARILGWAQRPYYDSKSKKLYWAKTLQFDNQQGQTLNYDIRILGRTGYVNVKIVDSIDQLGAINTRMPEILSMMNFTPGNKYSDFNSHTDRIAEYGIGGLIVGGILAKAGFFKLLLGGLAAFWKVIAAGAVAAFAFLSRFFRKFFGRAQAS